MTSLTINNLPINNRRHDKWPDSKNTLFVSALIFSIAVHLLVFKALPWLEVAKTKPPVLIVAELQKFLPPPPPQEVKQEEVKPEITKTEPAKPMPKTEVPPVPVLASEHTEHTANTYTVPEIPKPAVMPTQPTTVASPETQTKEASEPLSSSAPSSNVSDATSSSNTWEDSDVWDEFGSNLQKLCERNKQYPAIAIRRGYQGSGKVLVRFSAEGKATSITMAISTGQKSLDDQSIEMVKKSLNELPVPTKFKGREFKLTIPVDFKLE